MKRYTQQYSEDNGKTWSEGPREYTSMKAARAHFDELGSSPSLDWRVGFLLKVRSGVTYRLFDRKKETVVE
jgi:hypothetical protein